MTDSTRKQAGEDAEVEETDIETLERRLEFDLDGQRLDRAAAAVFPQFTRAVLQRWIQSGALTLDGAQVRASSRVRGGQQIRLVARVERELPWGAEDVDFAVVHEDDAVIVIDKRVGLVVHPGAGNATGTLANGLLHRFPELAGLPRAGIVHRLDKDTSGLLVVARNEAARQSLVGQLAERTMHREYAAVAEGLPSASFSVDAGIARDPTHRLRMRVDEVHGKPARTHFTVERRFRAHTMFRCRLETGRTHQIRVHLRHARFPLVGDSLYGARGRLPAKPLPELVHCVQEFARQALHARVLAFAHPDTGLETRFEASLPADLQNLVRVLEADARAAEVSS